MLQRRTIVATTLICVLAFLITSNGWAQGRVSRKETLIICREQGPNSLDIQGIGTNRPAYGLSWKCGKGIPRKVGNSRGTSTTSPFELPILVFWLDFINGFMNSASGKISPIRRTFTSPMVPCAWSYAPGTWLLTGA